MLAHTAIALPFVFIGGFGRRCSGFDPALAQAAAVMGAGQIDVMANGITLPLTAPAIGVAALFAFLASFDELIVALFLAGGRVRRPCRNGCGIASGKRSTRPPRRWPRY